MKQKELKSDLLKRVAGDGKADSYYEDLVNDYVDLWKTKNMLLRDIKVRGVAVAYDNGGGQKGVKKNDSVDQVLKVNTQMLRILDSLGIKPTAGDDGFEEL